MTPDHFDPDYDLDAYERTSLRHSRWGIASFISGIGVALGYFLVIGLVAVMQASNPGGVKDNKPIVMLVGFAVIGLFLVNLFGVVLGIVGLCESRRNKTFAILGTVIGVLTIFGICGLMGLGMARNNGVVNKPVINQVGYIALRST